MDRLPLPPPFAPGSRLRYRGTAAWYVEDAAGKQIPILEPGMLVTVTEAKPGRRGTLRPLPAEFQDPDDVECVRDTTRDGRSVYEVPVPGGRPERRIIWPDTAHEWERAD